MPIITLTTAVKGTKELLKKIPFLKEIVYFYRHVHHFFCAQLNKSTYYLLHNIPWKNIDDAIAIESKMSPHGFALKKFHNSKLLFQSKHLSLLISPYYPWVAYEIFCEEIYNISTWRERFSVFDIGANRGYASLYFASMQYCDHVYSFELIPQLHQIIEENINLNSDPIKKKITSFPFGLGDSDKTINAMYLPHRDGISSISSIFLQNYAPEEKGAILNVMCPVKKSSTTLRKIALENDIQSIILKIDVEGAEYEIINDIALNSPEILHKTQMIIGDTHLGFENFENIVRPFSFKTINKNPQKNGTCPFIMVRKNNIKYIEKPNTGF